MLGKVIDGFDNKTHIIGAAETVILETVPSGYAPFIALRITEALGADTDIAVVFYQLLKVAVIALHGSTGTVKPKHHWIFFGGVIVLR